MFNFFGDLLLILRKNIFNIAATLQNQRFIWLMAAATALTIELFSVLFFQKLLKLNPCQFCVYIRFSFVLMAFGFLLGAIKPKNIILRIIAYVVIFYALIRGIIWDILLEKENILAKNPDYISECSPVILKYPLNLPLDKWFPTHFSQTGICGDDAWSFLWLNMSEWLFFVYGAFFLVTCFMFIAFLLSFRAKK